MADTPTIYRLELADRTVVFDEPAVLRTLAALRKAYVDDPVIN